MSDIKVITILGKLKRQELILVCENYLSGGIYIDQAYPIVNPSGNIWVSDPVQDRSWRFWLHSFSMLVHLTNGYEETLKYAYLEKGKEFILDWYEHNFNDSPSEMAWHDHSTAIRLILMCRFYQVWTGAGVEDNAFKSVLLKMVEKHCVKLSNEDFYMKKHNHGIDQDIALFTGYHTFKDYFFDKPWQDTALARFKKQMEDLFEGDGSYLEHSPHYAFLILDRMIQFTDVLKSVNNHGYKEIEERLLKQLEFLTDMLDPSCQIPPIGDSETRSVKFKKNSLEGDLKNKIDQLNDWANNQGKLKWEKGDAVYPQGGYAILKEKANSLEECTQLIFSCAFHSRVHKHHDDLSFILFAKGQPLIVDAGKHSYNYASEERQFIVSSKAHNSVIVDNSNTDIARVNIGKSALTSYFSSETLSFAAGCHCLYPGVIHSRLILYLKPELYLIFDYVEGHKDHDIDQNFLFAPNIQIQQVNNQFKGLIEDETVLTVSPLYHPKLINHELINGNREPLDGWISLERNKVTPTSVLRFRNRGNEARMATLISLNSNHQTNMVSGFEWKQDYIEFKILQDEYRIIFLHHKAYVVRNNLLLDSEYYEHKMLLGNIREAREFEFKQKYRSERDRKLKLMNIVDSLKNSLGLGNKSD